MFAIFNKKLRVVLHVGIRINLWGCASEVQVQQHTPQVFYCSLCFTLTTLPTQYTPSMYFHTYDTVITIHTLFD